MMPLNLIKKIKHLNFLFMTVKDIPFFLGVLIFPFTFNFFIFRFGKVLIVTEVTHMDPVLYPILRRDFTFQGKFYCF